jgi:hypothetical protein
MIFHEKKVLIVKKVYQSMVTQQKKNKKFISVHNRYLWLNK